MSTSDGTPDGEAVGCVERDGIGTVGVLLGPPLGDTETLGDSLGSKKEGGALGSMLGLVELEGAPEGAKLVDGADETDG